MVPVVSPHPALGIAIGQEINDQTCGSSPATGNTLKEVVVKAVGVKAQLEELLVDFAELVKIAQVTRNVTSQFLTDLQILKGRQVVSGAVQGGQVFK